LILGKIIKIAATRCHILKLKYTKFDFAGKLTALPRSLAGFKGLILLREGKGEMRGEGRVGKGRKRMGGEKRDRAGKGKRRGEEERGRGEGKRRGEEERGRGEGKGRLMAVGDGRTWPQAQLTAIIIIIFCLYVCLPDRQSVCPTRRLPSVFFFLYLRHPSCYC